MSIHILQKQTNLFPPDYNILLTIYGRHELREPTVYNSIITAIAGGASRSNEISTKMGMESAVCAKYLKVLLDLGIIKKETPITEKGGNNFPSFFLDIL